MKVLHSVADWLKQRETFEHSDIGFVPTMGALHEGHLSLVRKSVQDNKATLVSIFVNPTQFNNPDDLAKYPSQIEKDLEMLKKAGADYVILPTYEQLYPDNYRYKVTESDRSKILCGKSRPGHFDGVLTVVLKLLSISGASKAYFGEKDYQQLQLIRHMAEAFFLPVEIVAMPTVREKDGLAMSSRNQRLTPEQRKVAPYLYEILNSEQPLDLAKNQLEKSGFKVDYLEEHGDRRFAAVFLGEVRLIDNVEI